MLTPETAQIPPPENWQDFQRMLCDLYMSIWDNTDVKPYGRSGQAQKGIDIVGVNARTGKREAIQCKRRIDLSPKMIYEDYEIAKNLDFSIAKLIFATTAPYDTKAQDASIRINDSGPFPCEIKFWDDIKKMLLDYSAVFKKYYSNIFTVNDYHSKIVYLDVKESHYEILITRISSSNNHYGSNKDSLLIADLLNKRCETYSIGSHWSRLQGIIGYGQYDATVISNWINGFGDADKLLSDKKSQYFHPIPQKIP